MCFSDAYKSDSLQGPTGKHVCFSRSLTFYMFFFPFISEQVLDAHGLKPISLKPKEVVLKLTLLEKKVCSIQVLNHQIFSLWLLK